MAMVCTNMLYVVHSLTANWCPAEIIITIILIHSISTWFSYNISSVENFDGTTSWLMLMLFMSNHIHVAEHTLLVFHLSKSPHFLMIAMNEVGRGCFHSITVFSPGTIEIAINWTITWQSTIRCSLSRCLFLFVHTSCFLSSANKLWLLLEIVAQMGRSQNMCAKIIKWLSPNGHGLIKFLLAPNNFSHYRESYAHTCTHRHLSAFNPSNNGQMKCNECSRVAQHLSFRSQFTTGIFGPQRQKIWTNQFRCTRFRLTTFW